MNQNFKIGDSVIALSTGERPAQPRIKGNEYVVTDIFYCSTDGKQMVNIDNTPAVSAYLNCGCKKRHHSGGKAFTYSSQFVLNDPKAINNRLEEALDEEDYETAVIIRDLIL